MLLAFFGYTIWVWDGRVQRVARKEKGHGVYTKLSLDIWILYMQRLEVRCRWTAVVFRIMLSQNWKPGFQLTRGSLHFEMSMTLIEIDVGHSWVSTWEITEVFSAW